MKSIMFDAPYVAAILGAAIAAITVLMYQIRDLLRKRSFYEHTLEENIDAIVAAERVLKNGATPAVVRSSLLCMLATLGEPVASRGFTKVFASLQPKKKKPKLSAEEENAITEAIDKLHATHPRLAADVHKAMMGVVMAILVTSADKIEIQEVEAEGASNPNSVFAKAVKAMNGSLKGGDHDGINGGVAHA